MRSSIAIPGFPQYCRHAAVKVAILDQIGLFAHAKARFPPQYVGTKLLRTDHPLKVGSNSSAAKSLAAKHRRNPAFYQEQNRNHGTASASKGEAVHLNGSLQQNRLDSRKIAPHQQR